MFDWFKSDKKSNDIFGNDNEPDVDGFIAEAKRRLDASKMSNEEAEELLQEIAKKYNIEGATLVGKYGNPENAIEQLMDKVLDNGDTELLLEAGENLAKDMKKAGINPDNEEVWETAELTLEIVRSMLSPKLDPSNDRDRDIVGDIVLTKLTIKAMLKDKFNK